MSEDAVTGTEWVARFAAEIGVDSPTEAEFEQLLDLAGVAAHASERIAAPVSCWLAARAGLTPAEGLAAARRIEGLTG